MKTRQYIKSIAAVVALAVMVVGAPLVGARSVAADDTQSTVQQTQTSVREAVANKAAETKLRICEKKQVTIQNRLTRIASQGDGQLAVFDKVAEKVKAFAVAKQLTARITNYSQLVAEVDAARVTATAAVQTASEAPDFTCSADDPAGSLSAYRANVQNRNGALKSYQTAVKNFLVAVKTAYNQSTTTTTNTTEATSNE